MRQIKFRAWENRRGQWTKISGNVALDNLGIRYWLFGENAKFLDKQEDFVVQQFTGLKDKNGCEIYEGDVVNYKQPSTYGDGYDITLAVR